MNLWVFFLDLIPHTNQLATTMGAQILAVTSPRLFFTSVYFSISVSGCSTVTSQWATCGNQWKPKKPGYPCPFSWKLLKTNDELWMFKLGWVSGFRETREFFYQFSDVMYRPWRRGQSSYNFMVIKWSSCSQLLPYYSPSRAASPWRLTYFFGKFGFLPQNS